MSKPIDPARDAAEKIASTILTVDVAEDTLDQWVDIIQRLAVGPAEKYARDRMCECGTAHYCQEEFDAVRREGAAWMRDMAKEEVRRAVYESGWHRSIGYCLGKLRSAIRALPLTPDDEEK